MVTPNKQATIELNLTDGWEGIVNSAERHNARVRFEAKLEKRRQEKLAGRILDCGICAAIAVALGVSGLAAPWVAAVAAGIAVCFGCFIGGQLRSVSARPKNHKSIIYCRKTNER